FCRFTDDLVDSNPGVDGTQALFLLNQWEKVVRAVFDGASSGIQWLDELLHVSNERGVAQEWISDLIAGVRFDTGVVRISTFEELDRYCYQVASTVGLWVSTLCSPNVAHLRNDAIHLGMAMQLTNIVRDVGEDLQRDRIYVPKELLAKHGLNERDLLKMLHGEKPDERFVVMLDELISRANDLYEQSWSGIVQLPLRMGIAIAIAATTYRGIHGSIKRNQFDTLHKRAYTTLGRKIAIGSRGVSRLLGRRLRYAPQ
ncbi:MAG: phytoene/squalene synthase family protein, partial [Rhodothermales bacterium]|nr:phytoene/squalene synthase family protein [Rhodothermales bacterium]